MNKARNLKSCPGCNSNNLDVLPVNDFDFNSPTQVCCALCGMCGPISESEIKAIEYWNALPRKEAEKGEK